MQRLTLLILSGGKITQYLVKSGNVYIFPDSQEIFLEKILWQTIDLTKVRGYISKLPRVFS